MKQNSLTLWVGVFVSNKTKADAIWQMYKMGNEERKKLGMQASTYARSEYSIERLRNSWDETLSKTIENWKINYKRWEVKEL